MPGSSTQAEGRDVYHLGGRQQDVGFVDAEHEHQFGDAGERNVGVHHALGPRRGAGRVQHGRDFVGRDVGQAGQPTPPFERRKRGVDRCRSGTVRAHFDGKAAPVQAG